MKSTTRVIFGVTLICNTYAAIRLVRSYYRFNRYIKNIDSYFLRKDVKHLVEENNIRGTL